MKKKKGFTLIELLAVIIILAIIALIATPIVMNLINKARKNAAEDSTYGIIKASENYIATYMISNDGVFPNGRLEFTCDKNGCKLTENNGYLLDSINFKGLKPDSGTIVINDSKIETVNLTFGNYLCVYSNEDNKVKCVDTNKDTIEIENINLKSDDKSITVTIDAVGNVQKYKYSIDGVNYFESDTNTYTFDNLEKNTLYTVYVKVSNNKKDVKANKQILFAPVNKLMSSYDYKHINGNILIDVTGNGNDGVLNNVNVTDDGLLFDGIYANDYVSLKAFNSQNFSINVVFKPVDITNKLQMIVGNFQSGGVGLYIDENGYICSSLYIDGSYRVIRTDYVVELNKVYAMTVTYNNNTFSMYINGELVDSYSNTKSLTYPENSTIFMMGQNPEGTAPKGEYFIGSIYYIDFYNEELMADEVKNINAQRLSELSSNNYENINIGLVSKYDASSVAENNFIDLSGNNNNGVVNDVTVRDNSLVFDGVGVNDYINLYRKDMSEFSVTATFSLSKVENSAIINNSQFGGCEIYIDANFKITGSCYINGSYRIIQTDYAAEKDKVYTATLNFDNKVLSFYVNGQLIGTYSSSYDVATPANNTIWVIGQNANGLTADGTDKLSGNIYSVFMHGRGLKENEILILQAESINKYPTYTPYSIDTNLLASYDASSELNSATSLKNLTGNSYDGDVLGATFNNNKLYFDGVDDYVKLKEYNLSNISLAVSFDLPTINSKSENFLANLESGGCCITMDSSNKAFGSCYINGAYRYLYSTDLIEANTKYNAVLTYDGSVLKFYLNGVLQDSYASTKGITSPSNSTIYVMGANPYGSTAKSHYLKGNIYKLKIYSRALTGEEILNLDL